jgi:hypothetical protein
MNDMFALGKLAAPLLLAAALGGCSSLSGQSEPEAPVPMQSVPTAGMYPAGPGPGSAAAAGQVGMGPALMGTTIEGSGSVSLAATCELYRSVETAKTPEDRQALIEHYMPGMSPEMRERHLQMMRQRCHADGEHY